MRRSGPRGVWAERLDGLAALHPRQCPQVRELQDRRLEGYDLVAVLLDGKTFAEDAMVTAVGVTITGEKVLLGFVQTATENRKVCAAFLRELVDRGLRVEAGLLVVTDGAKGIHAAVREVRRRGPVAALPVAQAGERGGLSVRAPTTGVPSQTASGIWHATCEAATRALKKVRAELVLLNASAAASLDEGLEETLTLHRLGLFRALGTSLKTTNAIESIHARVESRTAKGSLEEQRSEATLARHSALGSRAATAPHQELPRTPAAAGCAQTVRGRREATGGVNTWGRLPDLN